jgi:hypothetical protein
MCQVFYTPSKSGFPLLSLPSCRVVLLDDWRFNEDVLSYNVQLLWLEGKPFSIARPQNQCSGHVLYTLDAPVFVTTLESDIRRVKPGLQAGDVDMLLKRLLIFRFHAKLQNPDRSIPPCGRCFSDLVMAAGISSGSSRGPTISTKRSSSGATGSTPETKRHASWRVDRVVEFLHELELGHLEPAFRENGVDGRFLAELDEADLAQELGMTKLQARKLKSRLP